MRLSSMSGVSKNFRDKAACKAEYNILYENNMAYWNFFIIFEDV